MRSIDELAAEICTLAGPINAAHHRWLTLIAEYDRREGWSDGATQSCAHWLNWKCGLAMGAAREKVRVARALENLPKVAAAMASGALSYSKVREITRDASAETEDYLLMIAEHGTAAHVEKLVRAYRRCQEAEELSREARQQEGRRVSYRYDDDGSLILNCRLPAEAGAGLMKALDLAVEQLPVEDVPAGTSPPRVPFSMRRADALDLVAESFLAHGALEARGTDTHQIVVRVAAETLRDRAAGSCEFEHGPSMAAETARRLACDASVVELIENDDGEPLNVGRKTRTISAPLRRVLKARDKGCRFPGCGLPFGQGHHIRHWAHGGPTKLSNLTMLCRRHHRAVHEEGYQVERDADGELVFRRPDGRPLPEVPATPTVPAAPCDTLRARNEALHLHARTAMPSWSGERLDVGYAVGVLHPLATSS